ncbi:hypothetical protein Fmac_023551 [Flemingia macrophylla]|uniref:Uncharacterized protein n=1 Tax=Flemingia macrophylla TaxID=520843 RepID=A0ABD1LLU1_9FABA
MRRRHQHHVSQKLRHRRFFSFWLRLRFLLNLRLRPGPKLLRRFRRRLLNVPGLRRCRQGQAPGGVGEVEAGGPSPSAMAATSCARAAISAVGNVPSQILVFLLGSRTSQTHFPESLLLTPRYTGWRVSRNFFLPARFLGWVAARNTSSSAADGPAPCGSEKALMENIKIWTNILHASENNVNR